MQSIFFCVYRASFKHEGLGIGIRAGLGSAGIPAGYLNTTKKKLFLLSYQSSHKDSGITIKRKIQFHRKKERDFQWLYASKEIAPVRAKVRDSFEWMGKPKKNWRYNGELSTRHKHLQRTSARESGRAQMHELKARWTNSRCFKLPKSTQVQYSRSSNWDISPKGY